MNDPIVEEVRKYRNEHAKRFNYDLDAICSDLIKHQSLHSHRVISKRKKMPTCRVTRLETRSADL